MPEKPRAPDRNGELSRENKKLRDEVSSLTRQLQASNHVKELQKEKERNLRERNTEITKDNRKLREDILSLTQQLDSAQAELLREKQSFLEAMEELSEDELKEKMVTIYLGTSLLRVYRVYLLSSVTKEIDGKECEGSRTLQQQAWSRFRERREVMVFRLRPPKF